MTETAPRPRWIRMTEMLSVCGFFLVFAYEVYNWIDLVKEADGLWMLFVGGLLAYLAADFVSGFFHWFCDRFFEVDTPVIGSILIAPFREHHVDPLAMTRHDFFERNGNNCMVLVPFIFLWNAVMGWGGMPSVGEKTFLIFFGLFVFGTNQFHAWAHCHRVSWGIRWLQRCRLILPPHLHALHHHGDHSRSFCVTHGWLNPVLDGVGFFRFLEYSFKMLDFPVSPNVMGRRREGNRSHGS